MQNKYLLIIIGSSLLIIIGCIDNKLKTVYTDNISEMFSSEKLLITSQIQKRQQLDTILAGYILGSTRVEAENHEEELFSSKLLIKSGKDTLLNIPKLLPLKISKDFVSNKLSQIWFTHDLKVEVDYLCDGDLTWPTYRDLESFLYQKYGGYQIYYCPKDQEETYTVWINGDLSINLYRHYREIRKAPSGTICDGMIMIRYYKNSLIEAKAKFDLEKQREDQQRRNQKEQIRRDSISKYF